jgi:hypothetical protein
MYSWSFDQSAHCGQSGRRPRDTAWENLWDGIWWLQPKSERPVAGNGFNIRDDLRVVAVYCDAY